ncbi:sulfur carrier protein ThiS [bacterium]|nr:sulfur carrier protein ThiS [bacterium]
MVKLNGQEIDAAGRTVSEIIEKEGYNAARLAVELNGNIVPKAKYAETVVRENDVIEIVRFVGGG